MAVSLDTWRRAHGFTEADAPTPKEITLRMLMDKGALTPELTEAMLGALAPDVMKATRMAQQAASVAPVPPEVERLLRGPEETTEEPAPAEETPDEQPTV
jgi:hypothetical protein